MEETKHLTSILSSEKSRPVVRDHYATCTVTGVRRPVNPGDQLEHKEVGLIHPNGYQNRAARRAAMGNQKKGRK